MVDLPSTRFVTMEFGLERDDTAMRREDGSEVVIQRRGPRWRTTLEPAATRGASARAWRSFLAQLSTYEETVEVGPPEYDGPSTGYSGPAPQVDGADQLGTSLDCDGVTADEDILEEGDYLEVNGELKILTADATADGTGAVTFEFRPALREPPDDDAAVEINDPVATFRRREPEGVWSLDRVLITRVSLELVETF
ncbi:MAG: hypothetical protein ACOC5E_01965 [Acidobacteriota bacterium]